MVVRVRTELFRQRLLRWTADLLILGGLVALLRCGWGLGQGWFYQWVQGSQFAMEVDDGGAGGTEEGPPLTPPVASSPRPAHLGPAKPFLPSVAAKFQRDPLVIGRLDVSQIGLSVMIREGVDDETLLKAAGHLTGSALPGEAGNFVLLGHRDTFFRALRNVQRGNFIRVQTRNGRFSYVVDSFEVTVPESIGIERTPQPGATLITCFPFTYVGPAPRRFVVRAHLAESSAEVGP